MITQKNTEDLSTKIKIALDKAVEKVIAETKTKNCYLVFADDKGNIKKVFAKDL